jgi:NCAIR mutase (PurE)-related protein
VAEHESDPIADALAQIAREELGIETLEVRGQDRLDFHDVGVAGLRRPLEGAHELGAAPPLKPPS